MSTHEELAQRLAVVGKLLDAAATEIRDLPLEPTHDHIRAIGEALTKVFQIQRAIFAVRPDLEPAFLREQSPNPEADRRLTVALGEAYRLAEANRVGEASHSLRSFASTERSERHKAIAILEAERLEHRGRK